MKFPAVFALVVGIGMIGQWIMSFAQKQIPELKSEPIRIWFHIAGELITAVCLIISGIGLLNGIPWSHTLFLISSGMLMYTAIVSPGYFAQKGQWIWVVIFGFLILISVLSILSVTHSSPI
ncbi:hypothetical protein ES705_36456 [subsurface metagenome]